MNQPSGCPSCGALLDGQPNDPYQCRDCGVATPRAALVPPRRMPFAYNIDRMWNTVAADFDRDGWFEICGWHNKQLTAIDVIDKTLMWTLGGFRDDHDLHAGPGRVYVVTDGDVTAVNAYTGMRVWTQPIMNVREIHDPGYFPHGVIWALTSSDRLVVIDRATGARRTDFEAHDSASLFRTLVGRRLVVNSISVKILDAVEPGEVEFGTSSEKLDAMMDALVERGEMISKVPMSIESAHVHRGVLYMQTHQNESHLDAIHVATGRLAARRVVADRSGDRIVAAVSGHPVTGDDAKLKREPDGPVWSPPPGSEREIEHVHAAGRMLIVHVTYEGPGRDRHALFGVDGTSFTTVWQLDDIGYLMSDFNCSDERIVFAVSHKFVAVEPTTGRILWEAGSNAQRDFWVGGGLVVDKYDGRTFLAHTGDSLFPQDNRSMAAPRPGLPPPDELPTWGTPPPAPKAKGGGLPIGFILLFVVIVAGIVIAALASK